MYSCTRSWGTGVRGLTRGLVTRYGNQEPLVVKEKVGKPHVSLQRARLSRFTTYFAYLLR